MSQRKAAFLLGPPGSGKTTVAEQAAGDGIAVIQTGRLLRDEVERGSDVGARLRPILEAGRLVPVDVLTELLSQAVSSCGERHLLFDGFPRSHEQVAPFFRITDIAGAAFAAALVLQLSRRTVRDRLEGRRYCPRCGAVYNVLLDPPTHPGLCNRCGTPLAVRSDDTTDVVAARLDRYKQDTIPVAEHFKREYPSLTFTVEAEQPLEAVVSAVRGILEDVGMTSTSQEPSTS